MSYTGSRWEAGPRCIIIGQWEGFLVNPIGQPGAGKLHKGFNSDITIQGRNYHVQTEDWGWQNPYVVSQIYRDGAVLRSIKTSYNEIFQFGPVDDGEAILLAMREQHQKILDLLLSGQLFF